MDKKPSLAFIASFGLGDGLLALIMAHALNQQYEVTFYSTIISGLSNWLPEMKLAPYPKESADEHFAQYDLVVSDIVTPITNTMSLEVLAELGKQYILYAVTQHKIKNELKANRKSLLEKVDLQNLGDFSKELTNFSGEVVYEANPSKSIADCYVLNAEKYGLADVKRYYPISIPENLTYRKYQRRVIIHPSASESNKMWQAKRFIKLAKRLRQKSWEPIFILAPHEKEAWISQYGDDIPIANTLAITDLAGCIYESRYFIGCDSGPGHLASLLGIPGISIFRNPKKTRWHPDWERNIVVTPWLFIRFFKKRIWRPFVSVKRVEKAFNKIRVEG